MIEVIKNNTKQKFFTLCETCLSELSYEYEDVVIDELQFSYIPNRHIVCPVCGKETFAGLRTKEDYSFDTSHFKASSPLFGNCCIPATNGDTKPD